MQAPSPPPSEESLASQPDFLQSYEIRTFFHRPASSAPAGPLAALAAAVCALAPGSLSASLSAATLEVTTAEDSQIPGDGLVSLREAITLAATTTGLDRIEFAPALSGATITTSSPLSINDESHEIDASSLLQPVVLSGNNTHQILKIQGGTIVLRGLELTAGSSSRGGAIETTALGQLRLDQCRFINNQAGYGGAVFTLASQTVLDINASEFSGNHATVNGGALHSTGPATISESTFISGSARIGAAIYISRNLTVSDSTFEENVAMSTGGAIWGTYTPSQPLDPTLGETKPSSEARCISQVQAESPSPAASSSKITPSPGAVAEVGRFLAPPSLSTDQVLWAILPSDMAERFLPYH